MAAQPEPDGLVVSLSYRKLTARELEATLTDMKHVSQWLVAKGCATGPYVEFPFAFQAYATPRSILDEIDGSGEFARRFPFVKLKPVHGTYSITVNKRQIWVFSFANYVICLLMLAVAALAVFANEDLLELLR